MAKAALDNVVTLRSNFVDLRQISIDALRNERADVTLRSRGHVVAFHGHVLARVSPLLSRIVPQHRHCSCGRCECDRVHITLDDTVKPESLDILWALMYVGKAECKTADFADLVGVLRMLGIDARNISSERQNETVCSSSSATSQDSSDYRDDYERIETFMKGETPSRASAEWRDSVHVVQGRVLSGSSSAPTELDLRDNRSSLPSSSQNIGTQSSSSVAQAVNAPLISMPSNGSSSASSRFETTKEKSSECAPVAQASMIKTELPSVAIAAASLATQALGPAMEVVDTRHVCRREGKETDATASAGPSRSCREMASPGSGPTQPTPGITRASLAKALEDLNAAPNKDGDDDVWVVATIEPFRCFRCGKRFLTSERLHKHLVTHYADVIAKRIGSSIRTNSELSFECSLCRTSCSTRFGLIRHFALKHCYLDDCLTDEEAKAVKLTRHTNKRKSFKPEDESSPIPTKRQRSSATNRLPPSVEDPSNARASFAPGEAACTSVRADAPEQVLNQSSPHSAINVSTVDRDGSQKEETNEDQSLASSSNAGAGTSKAFGSGVVGGAGQQQTVTIPEQLGNQTGAADHSGAVPAWFWQMQSQLVQQRSAGSVPIATVATRGEGGQQQAVQAEFGPGQVAANLAEDEPVQKRQKERLDAQTAASLASQPKEHRKPESLVNVPPQRQMITLKTLTHRIRVPSPSINTHQHQTESASQQVVFPRRPVSTSTQQQQPHDLTPSAVSVPEQLPRSLPSQPTPAAAFHQQQAQRVAFPQATSASVKQGLGRATSQTVTSQQIQSVQQQQPHQHAHVRAPIIQHIPNPKPANPALQQGQGSSRATSAPGAPERSDQPECPFCLEKFPSELLVETHFLVCQNLKNFQM